MEINIIAHFGILEKIPVSWIFLWYFDHVYIIELDAFLIFQSLCIMQMMRQDA